MPDITILGAGVAGLTAATALAEAGASVDIIEQGRAPGKQGCYWFAGGMLAPWCEQVGTEPAIAKLGQQALSWWQQHLDCTQANGTLVVAHARDQQELSHFAANTRGYDELTAEQLAALEPDLAGCFRSGLFFSDEGHLDPRLAIPSLMQRLQQQGVVMHFNTDARAISPTNRTLLDCRGQAAIDELDDLRGVRGEMLLLSTHEITLSRPVRLLHPRGQVYVIPRGDGMFMVGGTVIESDDAGPVTARSAVQLLNAAYAIHPAFAEANIVELGVGIRPAFRNNLPQLRWQNDRWYLNGLFRHGFLLSPAMAAKAVATLIEGKAP